jgi:hypothetical protein
LAVRIDIGKSLCCTQDFRFSLRLWITLDACGCHQILSF